MDESEGNDAFWMQQVKSTTGKEFITQFQETFKQMNNPAENKYNGCTAIITGSSGCGKTTLIRYLIDHMLGSVSNDTSFILLFMTPSVDADALQGVEKYKNLILCPHLSEDLITWMKRMQDTYGKSKLKTNFVLILDDMIATRHKKVLENCFLTYRNANITSIICIQYLKLIEPSIRSSIYMVICLPSSNKKYNEVLIETYLSSYIPGKNKQERIENYSTWAYKKGQGFFVDNLAGGIAYLLQPTEQGGYLTYALKKVKTSDSTVSSSKKQVPSQEEKEQEEEDGDNTEEEK